MPVTDLKYILKENPLFSGLSILEREKLENIIFKMDFEENQNVLSNRVVKDTIFIVCRGEMLIEHTQNKHQSTKTIRQLTAGDIWYGGEFNDDEEKLLFSISPKAQVMTIRLSDLFYQVEYRRIYTRICQNLSLSPVGVVKKISDEKKQHHYLWLFNRDELEQRILSMQNFITTIFILLSAYIFFLHISQYFHNNRVATILITFLFTLFSLASYGIMLSKSYFSPAVVGLTFANTRLAVKEALIGAIPLASIAIIIKWMLILTIPQYHNIQVFDFSGAIALEGGSKNYIYEIIIYSFLTIPVRELIFRGGVQGFLQQLFAGRKTMWEPILLANLIMSCLNLMVSPLVAVISFFPGLYWGWLFAKHNNLIGVILSHVIFGIIVFFVVGYFDLLIL